MGIISCDTSSREQKRNNQKGYHGLIIEKKNYLRVTDSAKTHTFRPQRVGFASMYWVWGGRGGGGPPFMGNHTFIYG